MIKVTKKEMARLRRRSAETVDRARALAATANPPLHVVCCANGQPHRDLADAIGPGEDCVQFDADEAATMLHHFDAPDDGGHMSPPLDCGPHAIKVYVPA